MFGRILTCTLLSIGLVDAAFAQPMAPEAQTPEQIAQRVPQQIRDKLTEQGFTDVQVIPGSFLVSAKDKNGNPVRMLIGPNSTSVLTMGKGSDEQAQMPKPQMPKPGDSDSGRLIQQ